MIKVPIDFCARLVKNVTILVLFVTHIQNWTIGDTMIESSSNAEVCHHSKIKWNFWSN